jgi:hypothetical protein
MNEFFDCQQCKNGAYEVLWCERRVGVCKIMMKCTKCTGNRILLCSGKSECDKCSLINKRRK